MKTESDLNPVWVDRLTGAMCASPESSGTIIGRWIVCSTDQAIFVNSVRADMGDFLVPEPAGQWHVLTETGARRVGSVHRVQLAEALEAESVRTIGDRLRHLAAQSDSWLDWIDVVPVVPGIAEKVDLQPLEILVRENLGALEAVCRRPRAHLRVDVERVPVSRLRRLPPVAISYLAAHTEDWDRRLIRGILPKRIKAETRCDQFDIYENRVAARLLDNLVVHLDRRIRVLQRLLKVFRDKTQYSDASHGTWQRQNRIASLWGESIDVNEGSAKAQACLAELKSLKYKIMGLLGSTLYAEVPRRAQVATTLKNTNILVNDQYYRRVALIWREWANTGVERAPGPKELNYEAQRLCLGMDSFAVLLLVRALDSLGFEPTPADGDAPLRRGAVLTLAGRGCEISLRWCQDGTVEVDCDGRKMLIVAIPMNFDSGSDALAEEVLARIRSAADCRKGLRLAVLYLASTDNTDMALDPALRRSLHTVGNDPTSSLSGCCCLPVSPWEIGSTERVSRALRWFLIEPRMMAYPHAVELTAGVRTVVKLDENRQWIVPSSGIGAMEFVRPPHEFEWQRLNLDNALAIGERELAEAEESHRAISEEQRRAVRERRTGTLTQEKRDAHEKVDHCTRLCSELRDFIERFKEARLQSTSLLGCPICGATGDPNRDFEPRDSKCFRSVCRECRSEWGARLCGNGHRYAFIRPGRAFLPTKDCDPGWEDRVYGGDLLALPAAKADGEWGFMCPECGDVS